MLVEGGSLRVPEIPGLGCKISGKASASKVRMDPYRDKISEP